MRDYTKFFTPEHVANQMVNLLNLRRYDIVLDACAGSGNLAKAVSKKLGEDIIVDAIEIDSKWELTLNTICDRVFIADLEYWRPLDLTYNKIISNPPFGNGINLHSVFNSMWAALNKRGTLVMLAPVTFDVHFGYRKQELHIENWATNSDGTKTDIKIIKLEKL
jgi:16S rRNA G1207 methylase RsmC